MRRLLLGLLFCFAANLRATVLDSNFTEAVYANVAASAQVTGLAWAPDGSNRLFVSRKTGQITIIKNGAALATPFATLSPIYLNSECGLIGICFDPNFVINGYVYVFVTVSQFQQQIIRYTAVGDLGTNKTILVTNLPTLGNNHDGGAIGVGRDGKLYWAIGDNGNGTGVDGDMLTLASKVGRANLDGTVPIDNPFRDGAGPTNDYIWARGFRNPFTFTFQPATGALWVNCVGTSYEQIFLVQAGNHAGWNDYENTQPAGYITPKIKYRTNGTDTRNVTAANRNGNVATFTTSSSHGFRQGEKITISGVTDTNFNGMYYVVSTPSTTTFTVTQPGPNASSSGGSAVTQNQGGAVSGGTFYDSTGVPPSYRGNFFYGDYNSGRVMRAILGNTNEVLSVDYFATGISSHIDTAVGPDGALYYAGFGGTVYRLVYNFSQQQLIVTPINRWMFEGGMATLTVRLATAPLTNIDVTVSRSGGDSDLTVFSGAALTFTPANWSVPQIVRVQAASDSDSIDDVATFSVAASGLTSQSVNVRALDLPASPFRVGPIAQPITGAVRVALSGEVGRTYVLEANTNLVASSNWTPLSTNQLLTNSITILDSEATNLPTRFYRARLVP